MKKLEYSKIASKKLKGLRGELTEKFGDAFSADLIRETLKSIRQLEQYPDSGVQIAKLYDIDTDYWYLFVNHNYFIYRVEKDKVIVLQIFNEKEDFMQSLFGITGRTQESIDYWGE